MSIVKRTLLALGLILASVAPSVAADGGMDDGMAWTLNPGGSHSMLKLTTAGMNEAMKTAKPLPGGVVVFMNKGKLYMADDPKGTLFQMLRDKNMSGS